MKRWLLVFALAGCTAGAGAAADCGSTTTEAATTTVAPTTTIATTTTLAATTTTAAPTTTMAATTTTVAASGDFFADFTDPADFLGKFRHGLWRRDNTLVAQTQWPADHAMNCGAPTDHRTIHRSAPEEGFYLCGPPGVANQHLMVSEGDTSGYSIGFVSPNQTFNMAGAASVCWEINLTNMGTRQWFEVGVIPATAPDLFVESSIASAVAGRPEVVVYPKTDYAVTLWSGPSAWLGKLGINGNVNQWNNFNAGSDVATRYPMCFRDNGTGTLTTTIYATNGTTVLLSHSRPGSFPHVPSKVMFEFKTYTSTKDGAVISTTWHLDTVKVTQ